MRGKGHLMLAIPLYVISVQFLSRAPDLVQSPFFAAYCLVAMVGALFPDVDWAIDRVLPGFGHRNPLTHSLLGPLLLYLLFGSDTIAHPLLLNAYHAFTFGIATHLFGDVLKRGNLAWIRSRKHERTWYLLNGIVVIVLLHVTEFLTVFPLAAAGIPRVASSS
jgi:hypothetical protein